MPGAGAVHHIRSGLMHCNMIGETLIFCSGLFLIFERMRKELLAADGMRGSTS